MSNSDTGAKDSFGHRIELSISCGIVDIVTFLYRQKQRVEVDFAEIGRTLDVEASNSNCCCEGRERGGGTEEETESDTERRCEETKKLAKRKRTEKCY